MSGHHPDDVLRRAFEAVAESADVECTPEDLDRVWRAVRGELPPTERRDLVERLATTPALAEAWRVAHELQRGLPVPIAAERPSVPNQKFGDKFSGARRPDGKARRPRISGISEGGATPPAAGVPAARFPARWGGGGMPRPENVSEFLIRDTSAPWGSAARLAAAAVLMLAVTLMLVSRRDRPGDDTTRNPGSYAIESLVTSEAALPREAFGLRWSPGPQDARYQVRVTTEDLRLLTTASDLTEPQMVIDRALFAGVTPGSRIFWQVEVTLPSGERSTSPTFVVRVE